MANKERREQLIRLFEGMKPAAQWAKRLAQAKCPICGLDIDESDFRDDISRKEFAISHICQKCQDETFKPEP